MIKWTKKDAIEHITQLKSPFENMGTTQQQFSVAIQRLRQTAQQRRPLASRRTYQTQKPI